ncbi:MAG: hypothetical protein HQL90_14815 [Magnetococcales bacterium]|nr:hypothetical protein [Magnetococcales bacterium]
MGIGYAVVKKFYDDSMSRYKAVRDMLLEAIHETHKDGEKLLYAVNDRIKELDSLYLKCKRKNIQDESGLERLEDNVGIRMLCLFEQQIYPAHQMLLRIIDGNKKFVLRELTLYNWDNATRETMLREGEQCISRQTIKPWSRETSSCVRFLNKGSGYKSLHYIVYVEYPGGRWTAVEVQLRTLIQDLWGQMEHTVAYKRNSIAPYIRKNFQLLAGQLGGIEDKVGWLKESADKDYLVHSYFQEQYRPLRSMKYETAILPHFFNDSVVLDAHRVKLSTVRNRYQEYVKYVEAYRRDSVTNWEEWLAEAWSKICELHGVVTSLLEAMNKNMEEDIALLYWFHMEAAFLLFCGSIPDVNALSDWKCECFAGLRMAPWFSAADTHQNGNSRSTDHALSIYRNLLKHLDPADDEKDPQSPSEGHVKDFLSDRYVIHFRIGEILHAQDKMDRALVHFDQCETIMNGSMSMGDASMVAHSLVNRLSIHIKLAHIYWSLGAEYYPLSLARIDTARQLYRSNKEQIDREVGRESVSLGDMIENNLLWYHTEQLSVLIAGHGNESLIREQMDIVNQAMKSLTDSLQGLQQIPNHLLDTVAWYHYQRFRAGSLFGGGVADLKHAKDYAHLMWDQRASAINPSAVYLMEALEGRKNRLQEILHAHASEFKA